MSRQPTWDMAAHLQAQMFKEVANLGALDIKMIYFRGDHAAERGMPGIAMDEHHGAGRGLHDRHHMPWRFDPDSSRARSCSSGIQPAQDQRRGLRRRLCRGAARESGAAGASVWPMPVFRSSSSRKDPIPEAEMIFRELAQITHGAYQHFDQGQPSS